MTPRHPAPDALDRFDRCGKEERRIFIPIRPQRDKVRRKLDERNDDCAFATAAAFDPAIACSFGEGAPLSRT